MDEKYRKKCDNLLRRIKRYNPGVNNELLNRACDYSYEAHKDQLRKSGKPYFEHAIEVAKILSYLRLDQATIIGGLLHDVPEDTGVTIQEIEELFGADVARLVDGVTKIGGLGFDSFEEKQAEDFRKMIFSMIKDIRVILIKFADRLHNMRTLEYLPEKKRERIARETRDIYAPLAHRLGLARIRWELEDLCLKFLEPDAYWDLMSRVQERREERERYLQKVVRPLRKALNNAEISATITGRPKHFYAIYHKIHNRGVPFDEIYDLLAIRIIVENIEDCYKVLGHVHNIYLPIHDRFKDYIATPKTNMYQSLHTTVVGPEGRRVEIQIRTREMHRVAEDGIAAHWKYKEGKAKEDELDKYLSFLRKFLDWEADAKEPSDFMANLQIDLFRDEVFVFTPKGKLFKLPIGSTPVDFAFEVHTDIGLHCIAAKVNGKIVPLHYKLRSGDSVEILTSPNQKPNPDWIMFVKTSKARNRIKRWIRDTLFESSVRIGKEIYKECVIKYRLQKEQIDLKSIAQSYSFVDEDNLFAAIGRGDVNAEGILRKIMPQKFTETREKEDTFIQKFIQRARGSARGVRVQGEDDVLIEFANCCQPIPGDPILGFVTKGQGVVVHRSDCNNILKLMEEPERCVLVEWDVDREKQFLVSLYILCENRKGMLADISRAITDTDTEIVGVDLRKEDNLANGYIMVQIKNLRHLTRVMSKISAIKGIISVTRLERSYKQQIYAE